MRTTLSYLHQVKQQPTTTKSQIYFHYRSHDNDLYAAAFGVSNNIQVAAITKNISSLTSADLFQRLFQEQAVAKIVPIIEQTAKMPQIVPEVATNVRLRRRAMSEPVTIAHPERSRDHYQEPENISNGEIKSEADQIRYLVENGVAVCGSPIKMNYLTHYQPASDSSSPLSPSTTPSTTHCINQNAFNIRSSSSSLSDYFYIEEDEVANESGDGVDCIQRAITG